MKVTSENIAGTLELEDGRRRSGRWFWIAAGVLIFVVAALAFTRRAEEQPVYVTEAASRGQLLVIVTATGTLQPTNQVDIGSEISGVIDEVFVDFNDNVAAGEVIARLNTEQLQARAASTRASLAVAEAALAQAQATATEAAAKAQRSRDLAARNIVAQQTLETDEAATLRAAAAVASAKAQVTVAAASLRESETALRKAEIRAPINGVIISREVDPGQTVAASFQTPVLFKLAEDLRHMELHLDLDESDIGQVRNGQVAHFRVDAYPGRAFTAEIVSVRFNPRTVNNVVTYETVLSVANPELLLRPGMTATADIRIDEKHDSLLVPNRALRFLPPDEAPESAAALRSAGPRVWVVRDGQPAAVAVTTGLTNGEFTEVVGNEIGDGTQVIVDVQREPRRPAQRGPF